MSATTDALGTAVDAENAAIFAYGVTTAFVSSGRRQTVAENIAAHRALRDALDEAIRAGGGTPPEAATGYTLPTQVTDGVSAARAALTAEDDCAEAYRQVLERAETPEARRLGVDGLTGSASRAAAWRMVLQQRPATVAFPGAPG